MINTHYSMNRLQILLIWLLSSQGISGHNWLKCCIISQMPDLLKILDCCTTQETNLTWCNLIVCFSQFTVLDWGACITDWTEYFIDKNFSFYQWKNIFPYLNFFSREVRVCKILFGRQALLLRIIIFIVIIFVISFKESSRLINILSSVVLKQKKQEQNSQQTAEVRPTI